jgi:hypothetical protein
MTGVFSLLGFVAHLHAIDRDMHELGPAIIAAACQLVCTEAKRVLGVGYIEWAPLSPETLAHKTGPGPLKESGQLHDSIGWTAKGNEGWVGSDDDRAIWHELGTFRIPARSFLAAAAMRMESKIHTMAARAAVAVLAGRGLHGSEMAELFHLLKDLANHVKKDIKEIHQTLDGEGDDNNNKGRHR